jgi:Tfp pilus assembly protein PilX
VRKFLHSRDGRSKGAALIIVLAFVVLLTGLALAYFSRATTDRQLAHSSYNDTYADLLARSALDNIISDFRQEIIDPSASTATTVNVNGTNVTIYTPILASKMVPVRSPAPAPGATPAILNLIRRSVRSDSIPFPSRASAVNSTIDVSANGRSVSLARWNRHYLVPKSNTTDNGSDPITAGFNPPYYWAPDWVFVTNTGPAVISAPSASVIGRYAYAVYDEGGLLDANLVGLPSPSPGAVTIAAPSPSRTAYISRKGTVAFADLTALPLTPSSTPNPQTISKIVGWRNYATTTVLTTSIFPNLSPSPSPFVTYFLDNSRDFLIVNPILSSNNRTDQAFATRSELIQLVVSSLGVPNLLQYLGTFSRELNAPTWGSATNPIAQRFQLDNISLLGSSPTPAPTGQTAIDIQTYFGLQWSTTTSRWQYVGTQGAALLSAIPAPAPNGSPPPDFFQILNYAYPGNTIGQILSLGACIIDQYDADQVTTGIDYAPAPAVAWGAEDANPVVPMGSPGPSPLPTPIAGYSPVLQQPFQNVGELGYAFNPVTGTTLDFRTSPSVDAALLDFFTYNTTDNRTTYNPSYSPSLYRLRAGPVNINTRNSAIIAALLTGALQSWPPPGTGVPSSAATTAATSIATATNTVPAMNRQDIAGLAAAVTNAPFTNNEETREAVARVLSDTTQTRTWGLLIDVIAQSGRFKPNASSLQNDFIVEGEQHYWVHVAIDRFTGQVIDKQSEVVNE